MFDAGSSRKAVERDFGAIIAALRGLSPEDWSRPVRCERWTIKDLAVHLLSAARGQANGLRRASTGDTELARLDPTQENEPATVVPALAAAIDELLGALDDLPPEAIGGLVPLPFGLLPTPVALQIVALEYGFHHNDLAWAMGDEVSLSDDIASCLIEIAPGLLPMLAAGSPVSAPGVTPNEPIRFLLSAPSASWDVAYHRDGLVIAPVESGKSGDSCVISGDDSTMALFLMGRIRYDDRRLTANSCAGSFKLYFPGP